MANFSNCFFLIVSTFNLGRLVQGALLGVTHGGRLGCWLLC